MTSTRIVALLGLASLSIGVAACSNASSQGLSSRNFDKAPAAGSSNKAHTSTSAPPTLNLDLSIDDAYAAIPHKRTTMDFAASSMNDQDKRFLEVAFHLIDQAIRLRVTTCQKFSRGDVGNTSISDMDRLIDYLQNSEPPESLKENANNTAVLLKLSDVYFLFGDLKNEQSYREKVYGTLRAN